MRVLAIGTHPDDIEIACSGTLAKCVKRGDTVIVCHASSGDLGRVVIPPEELKVIRANEAKKAGAMSKKALSRDEEAKAIYEEMKIEIGKLEADIDYYYDHGQFMDALRIIFDNTVSNLAQNDYM